MTSHAQVYRRFVVGVVFLYNTSIKYPTLNYDVQAATSHVRRERLRELTCVIQFESDVTRSTSSSIDQQFHFR